ncbi:MAG: hypothetical protein KDI32_06745, partial [Pseudomonadales bacterium]|nr:hypothetical protein [Pseudomonadales bacterium]
DTFVVALQVRRGVDADTLTYGGEQGCDEGHGRPFAVRSTDDGDWMGGRGKLHRARNSGDALER